VLVAFLLALAACGAPGRAPSIPFGFTAPTAEQQERLERRARQLISRDRIVAFHRMLTDEPHVAGSPRDRALAEWVETRWRDFGLDEVELIEHEVLLPYPEEVRVELVAPFRWLASMKEDPVPGDPHTWMDVGLPYHAYSASGEVVAPVVYAGSGNPEEYEWLAARGIDVRGKIALVRYSVPYSYRGFKAYTAEQRGVAGILIYSDPADDGVGKGPVYPDGPWGPESHIQRGGIVYDFLVPGDPLTPGWPSRPGARRLAPGEAVSLPRIVSAPLSYKDARVILDALEGPVAPDRWQSVPVSPGPVPGRQARAARRAYRVGPGPAVVRLRVRMDDRVRPIWTVVGRIRGATAAEELVLVGNHRDAWVFGGVDPSSGTAVLMELARVLGRLVREGWRPRRTILLANWDAEEFTLTSSTEWGEQHAPSLHEGAVAYLNVDSAASGPHFGAAAVPALNRVIGEVVGLVRDPRTGGSVAAAWRARRAAERGALPTGGGGALVNNRLGSGSDYTVFLNFLGIPVADLSFDGPYGVYHSLYDTHAWVARIGDPGFRYHATMVEILARLVLRLAEADLIPLDYRDTADRVVEFVDEIERAVAAKGVTGAGWRLGAVGAAATRFRQAAAAFHREAEQALGRGQARLAVFNRALVEVERALVDPDGIPGRPWYRHLLYAPKFTYAPEVLPGLAEALEAGDEARFAAQAARLAAALARAAARLEAAVPPAREAAGVQ
jgi:N-acetylated-alpha-linked acidic dipeptidase